MDALYKAANIIVNYSLKVKEGEEVLLVTDKEKLPIITAIAHFCKENDAKINIYYLSDVNRPYSTPTRMLEEMIRYSNVLIYCLSGISAEKPFRRFLVEEGRRFGRVCKMHGVKQDTLKRAININYQELEKFTADVANYIRDKDIRVRSAKGTNITFSLLGRKVMEENGKIWEQWDHINMPAGEAFTCPVEETVNGKIVFDRFDEKEGTGKIVFKNGYAEKITGEVAKPVLDVIKNDRTGRIIGEFGIGTNPKAIMKSEIIEAEKAKGGVHFGLGDSYLLGKNKSMFHFCCIVEKPDIMIGKKYLMKKGKFVFE